ncbi:MAG TPA: ABC-F family ATP-binding cassette domain-containing protein, partial [Ignavibacteriaceae bacterium]
MIDLLNISLQFGGKYLFSNVNLKINSGDRYALVGSNGSGKSSLMKMISGTLEPESGKIQRQKRISIGYLPQEQVVHTGKTLIDEASSALEDIQHLLKKQDEITQNLSLTNLSDDEQNDLVHQLAEVHEKLEVLETFSANSRVEKVLTGLGFEESDFERLTDEFSGGWQMRIALAKILLAQNDILLFDEPTNHLDLDSLEWLITFIKKYKGAFVIVSHDRHFVNQTTEKTIELFNNKLNVFNGKYEAFLTYKEERDELLIHQKELQQKKIKQTERFIERFRYKASKARQVQSRVKQLEKIELIETPDSESEVFIRFPEPPKSGILNVELNEISKSYDSKLVLEKIDFRINRSDKVAFVGPNGAGKTTLGKIIAGKLDFNSGGRKIGHNTIISYYSQDVA